MATAEEAFVCFGGLVAHETKFSLKSFVEQTAALRDSYAFEKAANWLVLVVRSPERRHPDPDFTIHLGGEKCCFDVAREEFVAMIGS